MKDVLKEKLDNKNERLRKNIRIDYFYCFLKNFDVTSAIWVLYMIYKGMSLVEVGIAEGVFHLSSLLFEVPSGALADLFGRKKSIIYGRVCSVIAGIIMLFAESLFGFSLAFMVSAFGYNLNSGAEEALVYDSLKNLNEEEKYLKVSSRLNFIIELSAGIGIFVGGVLSEYSYRYLYIVGVIISLITLIPAFMFTEAKVENRKKEKVSIRNHFKKAIRILKENKKIKGILIYFPAVFTFNTIVFFYGQEYFNGIGFNKIEISTLMLVAGLISCIGALTSKNIFSLFKEKAKYIASIGMGISIVFLSFEKIEISIISFLIINYFNALLYPIQSMSLNKLIPSEERATIISMDSMIFSIFMFIGFPICGILGEWMSLSVVFFILGITQIISTKFLKID
ncbi:MAG: MFS transporter [Sarcina sp.]